MEVLIREAKKSDLAEYTHVLQHAYEDSYANETLGLTKECFSKKIFNSPDTQNYLASNLITNEKQKCWLAFLYNELVGSVSIIEKENEYELRGFYVVKSYQGKGIGKKLWEKALSFAKNKDITLDVYAHNSKTIEMYKKWGFVIDTDKGEHWSHWPEWPEGLQVKRIFMRLHNASVISH